MAVLAVDNKVTILLGLVGGKGTWIQLTGFELGSQWGKNRFYDTLGNFGPIQHTVAISSIS